MEFKGTKGEWYVDSSNPFIIWHPTIIREEIASISRSVQLEGAEHGFLAKYSKEEAEANAKLIASAPDLLEALQLMIEGSKSPNWKIQKAKHAIEKALK